MRLVLLGLPGAGKGTQGGRISEKQGIPHISTGSMIRAVIASGSKLGSVVDSYISRGHLIPDDIAIVMLKERLRMDDCSTGWILDGFPRTVAQAKHLDATLMQEGIKLDYAFDIRISEEEAIRRIEQRRMCRECGEAYHLLYYPPTQQKVCDKCSGELYQRPDDNRQTALQRLGVHMKQTHPVVHYYAQSGRLISINGEREIELVFAGVDIAFSLLLDTGCAGEVR